MLVGGVRSAPEDWYRDLDDAVTGAGVAPVFFGQDLAANQPRGVRAVGLETADPLCSEWVVMTLGPHTAVALIARERGCQDATPDEDRAFDFLVSHDRAVVTTAACALLSRVP